MADGFKSTTGSILFKIFWWLALHVNPRWAHRIMYWGLRDGSFGRVVVNDPALVVKLWGHTFKTPIGIGGGVDKRGNVVDHLMQVGYGFGTFGPYTLEKEMPVRQVSYFKKKRAILVQSLGFRNPGLLKLLPWFVKRRYLPHFVGIDLAIPAESEEQNIKQGRHFTYQEEFVLMAQKAAPYCDLVTLDLSHPSSELAMMISDAALLVPMIKAVREAVRIAAPIQTPPILIKIPLDLSVQEIPLVARILVDSGVDGVVIGGPLSMEKNSLLQLTNNDEEYSGMLYGEPAQGHIVKLIGDIYQQTRGQVPIIGCGGLFSAKDAFDQICAGATMVQVDNATLTFAGPDCVGEFNEGLSMMLKAKGFLNVEQAVGSAVKAEMEARQASMPIPPAMESSPVQQTTASSESQNPFSTNSQV